MQSPSESLPRIPLSVCLITQNVAAFLPYCLAGFEDLADEIIVVDSYSNDGTVELLRNHPKVRLFHRRFQDHFGAQKNFAIEQARGEWVLIVDSDEILGDRLRERLPRLIASPRLSHYKLARYWVVSGPPWVHVQSEKHYPDYQLRLFRNRPHFRYGPDKVVHTHFPRSGRGPGRKLGRCHIFHFDFLLKDRAAREAKVSRYLKLEPGSSGTSQMYLYETCPHRLRECLEPMTTARPDPRLFVAPEAGQGASAGRNGGRKRRWF